MDWIEFPDQRFEVNGLPWFKENSPVLCRLPLRRKDTYREPVWNLAQQPSGGRVRFSTDATKIGIRARFPDAQCMSHMPLSGQSGFDLYVDGVYYRTTWPDADAKVSVEWIVGNDRRFRDITIYMPLYKPVTIDAIGIEEGAATRNTAPFAIPKPIVFYGTSITQGGCASNPGTAYPALIGRSLNADFVNLGFSGNGLGEPELAQAIAEIDSSCIVLDHWANMGDRLKDNLPVFTATLRKAHPDVPIIVVKPFYCSVELLEGPTYPAQRRVVAAFVQRRRRAGDANIHVADGLKMISRDLAYGLVDGIHCNTLGFYLMERRLTPLLKQLLFRH